MCCLTKQTARCPARIGDGRSRFRKHSKYDVTLFVTAAVLVHKTKTSTTRRVIRYMNKTFSRFTLDIKDRK